MAAESGAEYVARRLSAPPEEPDRLAIDLSDNAAAFCAVPLLPREGMSDAEPSRAPRFTVIAPPLEAETAAPRYGVIDESAKLNLHALVSWDAEEPGAGRRALLLVAAATGLPAAIDVALLLALLAAFASVALVNGIAEPAEPEAAQRE